MSDKPKQDDAPMRANVIIRIPQIAPDELAEYEAAMLAAQAMY